MSNEGRPNIFTGQALADLPRFVKNGNRAIGLDLANEMDPSRGNRQRILQRQGLFGAQATNGFVLLCFSGSRIDQDWRYILRHIPMDEGRTGAMDLSEGGEPSAFPESVSPQAVQFFDFAIALGLGNRQEDKFDAQIQTQPNELPEDARRFVAAAESGIVVELQKLRDSQGFPGVYGVHPNCLVTFVGGNRLSASARV